MWTEPPAPHDGQRARTAGHRRRLIIGAIVVVLCLPLAFVAGLWLWALHGVSFPSTAEATSQRVIALQTGDGQALLPKGRLQLPPVPVEQMPADVVNAVVSIEDRRFYERGPIDVRSVLRAFVDNLQAGHVVAGGSTITQQLVKNLYLSPERTYKRKVQEAALSMWLEHHLTKNQILTAYLNNVYLGSGATGFPAAAKFYFGKAVTDLNLAEAAMLAGVINAPGKEDPLRNLTGARTRASAVLDAMVANGKISQTAALEAKLNPATPNPTQLSPPAAGWFADWVYRSAAAAVPASAGAVTVHTTLDLHLQEVASNIIESTLATAGRKMHATQAALVAMRPDGAVLAMVGGRDYSDSEFNRATQAQRQPGSVFKLFDYYAALRHGYKPNDTVLDEPVDIKGWEAHDYGRNYHGRVTLAAAFAHSYNAAAVRLSQEVGIPQVIAAARDLGLRAKLANTPSLALGASEVTLLDLTSAYAAVRAGAAPVQPWGIASVSLPNEQRAIPVGHSREPQHGLGQYQNELIELLRGVVEHGTGRAAALPGFAAGKTGTAQDYRDAWFVGFGDSLVVGVWVGNDDHSPMQRVTGGTLPATIWKKFMEQAIAAGSAAPAAQPQTNQPAPVASEQQKPNPPGPVAAEQPKQNQPVPAVAEQKKANQPAIAEQQKPDRAAEQKQASQPTPEVAEQKTKLAPALAEQQPRPKTLFNQNVAGAADAKCNVAACERSYRSFRASDCTYQPDEGGPRRFCGLSAGNTAALKGSQQQRSPGAQKPNSQEGTQASAQESTQRTERAEPGPANKKCNVAACQGFSSFRASDCTYQPYGGGPRQVCGRQDERTARTPRRERAARAAPDTDERRADFFAEGPDRDGPPGWPGSGPSGHFFGRPLFDWGGQD